MRLSQLRAQKLSLKSRDINMVNRGLESLDELDTLERAESNAVIQAQSLGAFGTIDWNIIFGQNSDDIPEKGPSTDAC
jgi:hypothetical protein